MHRVAVYIDNILVSGNNTKEYLGDLRTLFRHLNEKRLCYNLEKCIFAQPSVEYMYHIPYTHLVKGWSCQGIQGRCRTQDATSKRCKNTDIFHGLSAILRKVPVTIHV